MCACFVSVRDSLPSPRVDRHLSFVALEKSSQALNRPGFRRETPTSDSYQECVSTGLPQDATDSADVRHRIGKEHQVHLTGEFHVVLLEVVEQDLPQLVMIFHRPVRLYGFVKVGTESINILSEMTSMRW